jgi:hypothetical protein
MQVTPNVAASELFYLALPSVPKASVAGGARLRAERTVCTVDPYGVIQFAEGSRTVSVIEKTDRDVEVLTIY